MCRLLDRVGGWKGGDEGGGAGGMKYLDVLPVARFPSSRDRIRRSSLGGGTFRV